MSGWPKTGKPQGKVVAPNKLWHAFKHKNWDVLKLDLDAEEDHNYVAASERFLALQTQLGMVLHHTCTFQKTLEEALQQAVELADDFGRISSGQGAGNMSEPWAVTAGGQAFYLKAMLEESVVSLRQHLHNDLEESVLRSLREEVSAFSTVPAQMTERSNLKVEMLHYSKKLEELRGTKSGQKNNDEKVDRNKEKYAQASQALRDQTNQLMSTFAHAEQLRQRLLMQDLPKVIVAEKEAFDAFAVNMNKAATRDPDDPNIPFGIPPPLTSNPGRLPFAGPNPLLSVPGSEVPLPDSAPPPREASSVAKMEPPPPYSETQAIGKRQSPGPVSPKGSGSVSPWKSNSNGARAGPDSEAKHFPGSPNPDSPPSSADGDEDRLNGEADSGAVSKGKKKGKGNMKSKDRQDEHEDVPPPPAPDTVDTVDTVDARESDPPPHTVEVSEEETEESADDDRVGGEDDDDDEGDDDVGDGGMEPLPPGKVRVRALYDYEATQDGDLSFSEGDIIIAESSAVSGDGWVTGQCNGNEGIFPANYTEPC